MCSNDHCRTHRTFPARRRRAFSLSTLFLITLVLTAFAACGRKEPPKPPTLMVPIRAEDFSVLQRGEEAIFSIPYPTTTPGGLDLPPITAVHVFAYELPLAGFVLDGIDIFPAPETEGEDLPEEASDATDDEASVEADQEGLEGAPEEDAASDEEGEPAAPPLLRPSGFEFPEVEEPEEAVEPIVGEDGEILEDGTDLIEEPIVIPRAEDQIEIDSREFGQLAEEVMVLEGTDLERAIRGDRIAVRLPLEPQVPGEEVVRVYGVRTATSPKLVSRFSNLVTLVQQTPPEPPNAVAVTGQGNGVRINWESETAEIEGYNIYRRDAQSPDYPVAIAQALPGASEFLDGTAEFGNRYIYTVTTARHISEPVIESRLASEHEVDYEDRFPPPPPSGLLVLAEAGRIRVLWDQVETSDVAGFIVYRKSGDENWAAQNEAPLTGRQYLDEEVESAASYDYYVVAVDRSGNVSRRSEERGAQVP
jgi:hypothetical protein